MNPLYLYLKPITSQIAFDLQSADQSATLVQSICGGVARRLRINLDMRPPRALPAAHFDRHESHVIYGTGHCLSGRFEDEPPVASQIKQLTDSF